MRTYYVLGDNSPWVFSVCPHLMNRVTDSFCSGGSLQEYFQDKQIWKIRNIVSCGKEGRFVGYP